VHDAVVGPAGLNVQLGVSKLASSELRPKLTVPVGALALAGSGAVSVTVAVHVVLLSRRTGLGLHDTAVVVVRFVVSATVNLTKP
jgi:hypothetical protein